jgi:hypothetical protein
MAYDNYVQTRYNADMEKHDIATVLIPESVRTFLQHPQMKTNFETLDPSHSS